jgi:short-subunit dehydrogenase
VAGTLIDADSCMEDKIYDVNETYLNLIYPLNFIKLYQELKGNISNVNIIFLGSIAAFRGRSENILYSAAKRGLISVYESIRHQYGRESVIQYIYIGYVDTDLSRGKKTLLPKSSPIIIANKIIKLRAKSSGIYYIPWFWSIIRLLILLLSFFPFFLFFKNRLILSK